MKNKLRNLKAFCAVICLLSLALYSCSNRSETVAGKWKLTFNPENKTVTLRQNAKLIAEELYASYKWNGKQITTRDYATCKVTTTKIADSFGTGVLSTLVYTDKTLPTLTQYFYLYPYKDYLLTEFTLEGEQELSSNYMAPVNIDHMPAVLTEDGNSRALFIPFDNDKWIRYQSHPLDFTTLTSYEVTAIFNNEDRNALIAGSVEHDNWKSAITIGKGSIYNIGSLVCYGGVADELTRDSKPHGALTGKKIKSPKILLGWFNDWRQGLEEYALANATIAPPKTWNKPMPFGWNSWGVLQFDMTYAKAMEVSDYFKSHLQDNGFATSNGTLYIGLDSGWNSFTEEELKSFADQCKANGQVPGIYWTPFTDWGKRPEREIKDAPGYKYKDIYLYANGKPQELDGAYAIDPTHPAIEIMMEQTAALFHRTGYEYVKMDFMTHGAMEADNWYNPSIQTGIQAYNYGMQLLNKYFGDMYINLSISPVFPAHYAQSRRIACDAWNKIKDTEYTLNATSYGWWQDKVYQYNDADHIVLRDATEGENRARITSAVVTGLYMAGDDFSAAGSKEGKDRAVKFLTNTQVNAVATGEAFRPVEGNGQKSENRFIRFEKDGSCYYAVFNYTDKTQTYSISSERLQLDKEKAYKVKELWRGTETTTKGTMQVEVPGKDVMLFKITS